MNNNQFNQNNQNSQNNQYDINIENTRDTGIQTGANINQNPYINQNINPLTNNLQQNPQTQIQTTPVSTGFNNGDFIKGALIGAFATYLLTNKNAQEGIMKTVGKGSELFSAGIEELKERYEDTKAQMQANQEH